MLVAPRLVGRRDAWRGLVYLCGTVEDAQGSCTPVCAEFFAVLFAVLLYLACITALLAPLESVAFEEVETSLGSDE